MRRKNERIVLADMQKKISDRKQCGQLKGASQTQGLRLQQYFRVGCFTERIY